MYASRLHTIGMGVGFRGYLRHGAYLIENSEIRGFGPREIALLASVVRFHRSGVVASRYPPFDSLDEEWQSRARRLAAILHMADAADRGLDQSVESIDVTMKNGEVVARFEGIDPEVRREWIDSAEVAFRQVFGVKLSFDQVKVVDSF